MSINQVSDCASLLLPSPCQPCLQLSYLSYLAILSSEPKNFKAGGPGSWPTRQSYWSLVLPQRQLLHMQCPTFVTPGGRAASGPHDQPQVRSPLARVKLCNPTSCTTHQAR